MVWADNSVAVNFNGNTATVAVDDNVAQYITVTQNGAHILIAQSDEVAEEITYTLSGTSNDGEFYMSGSFKATIELNGLTLTNTNPIYSGAAINVQNSKRINVKVITGTTNTLADAASGSQKGCLYVKGHAEFKQYGTLNVVGHKSHGIKAGEYISIKNATINITSAVDDGLSCNQYFLMESGALNISGTGDDGIQCDLDGTTSTGMTTNHEDEDSGNIYISGGNITINCPGLAVKGIKSAGDVYISDNPIINVTTTGNGMWDTTDLEAKSSCGLDADGNITISGGTLTLTATGSGGKGMKCNGFLTISGGNTTVSTTGGLYYNNGSTQNLNYAGNVDQVNDNYLCAPKGVKAGTKTTSGYNTTYSGGIDISGGSIHVTTSGNNAEGIESKNYLNVTGGEIMVDAHDDGINAAQDLTITDGYVYSRGSNNDGIDANGNVIIYGGLIYAMGANSPEVAIDANSEENKKFYFYGGTIIAIGGLEQGSELNQSCYQASSWSSNTWYSITYGSTVIAFKTPSSAGSPLVVSASTSPTVKSGVTVNGGSSIFDGRCYLDATVSGGSNVTLSMYSGGGGGGTPPGPGGNQDNISATANPVGSGSIGGTGRYRRGETCTLTAIPNTGYSFNRWTKNGSTVSTNNPYSFQVNGNASYVAVFNLNSYTITATANPTTGGTVSGGGTYNHGSTCTLTANPNSGYSFVGWTINGTQVSTNSTYSFTVTENASYVAVFDLNSYTITASANPTAGGTVSGEGTYNYGSTCTLTATPNTGYSFVGWTKNGSQVSTDQTYSFTVTENASYEAVFIVSEYQITVIPSPVEGGIVAFGGKGNTEDLVYDFEDGTLQGWTVIQGPNGDSPDNWMHCINYTEENMTSGYGHNSSNGFVISESYISGTDTGVTPDNYLVSPRIWLSGSISFWATNLSDEYGAEHFAVAVSTGGNSDANDFTTVEEWTLPVTRTGGTRNLEDHVWYEYTVDLSDYRSYGYVAIHHFDCSNQWLLSVDDITITVDDGSITETYIQGTTCTVIATPNEGYSFVNWMKDGDIVSTEPEYAFTVTENADYVANFVVSTVTQTMALSEGVNWVSFNVNIILNDLKTALVEALPNDDATITIKSKMQSTKYQRGRWTGSFSELDMTHMYMIIVSDAYEITLEGTRVDLNELAVTISNGANWLAYPLDEGMTITDFFGSFPVDGDQVKSKKQSARYNNGRWTGSLRTLEPGKGLIYSSADENDREFTFLGSNNKKKHDK